MQGKIVQQVVKNEAQDSGNHQQKIVLDKNLAQGSYFLQFSANNKQQTVQIIKK